MAPGPGVVDALTLAPLYGEEVLLHTARDTHKAISGRVFKLLGPAATPVRVIHDGISTSVYAGLGLGLTAATAALRATGGGGPALPATVQSAITGIVGDRLRDEAHALHFDMALRIRGEDVPVDHVHLSAAYPTATGDVVVFLHGLCETETYWNRAEAPTYGQTLAMQGWTPVYLRYNSGLSIRENGAALSSLLQSLTESWPVPVRRITLVGHSMGGLVVRAAGAIDGPHDWAGKVTDVVFLGTPHLGAPLAKQAMWGGRVLRVFPESAALGRIIEHRSLGVRDLEAVFDAPSLDHARYRVVTAQMRGVAGMLLGDLFVLRASAQAFEGADAVHLADTHHFGLLNHPDVHAKLKEWLS